MYTKHRQGKIVPRGTVPGSHFGNKLHFLGCKLQRTAATINTQTLRAWTSPACWYHFARIHFRRSIKFRLLLKYPTHPLVSFWKNKMPFPFPSQCARNFAPCEKTPSVSPFSVCMQSKCTLRRPPAPSSTACWRNSPATVPRSRFVRLASVRRRARRGATHDMLASKTDRNRWFVKSGICTKWA